MADVYTVTFIIIGILISVPALFVAFNLLMPSLTDRAQARLDNTPVKCFLLGLPVTAFIFIFAMATFGSNAGVLQATAFITIFIAMGIGSIGGAGMARMLGRRLTPVTKPNSQLTNLVRGAIVFELACLVPLVGWFLFIPISIITLIGAAIFALLGWAPRSQARAETPAPAVTSPPLVIKRENLTANR